jgi:putative transcriptional regulator
VENLNLETLEGQLLIASPQMEDPRFRRSVILLLHHGEDGAMGVVLNQRLPISAAEQWEALGELVEVGDHRAHLGGPLPGSITVLHDVKNDRTNTPQGRIYVLQKQEQLEKLLKLLDDNESFQFFVGHAGWSRGQLESEIADGSWLSIPASPDFVFYNEQNDMWALAMREAGMAFYRDVLGIEDFPNDVALN